MYDELSEAGAAVFGVSRDSIGSHDKFSAKLELPFPLLSDAGGKICEAYGVIRDKVMYGKPVRGIERSTFLIDPEGVVNKVWRKVRVAGHGADVLAALKTAAQ